MRNVNGWTWVAVFGMAIPTTAMAQSNTIVDATYNVPPGEVVSVPAGNSVMLVERFTMGDGSRIEVSDETPLLVIRAKEATIGNDTMIFGRGHDGTEADAPGGEGESGTGGPTIVLIAERADIQGLKIAALGGDGGAGGKGQTGRSGRNASCFPNDSDAFPGGPGRPGGDGGDGGDGGSIFVVLPSDAGSYGIELNVNSGNPGDLGQGGDGGSGGRSIDCGFYKHGGKPRGPRGSGGDPGALGERGMVRWYHIADFEPATITERLQDIISVLANGGYAGDAEALQAVLETGVLTGR